MLAVNYTCLRDNMKRYMDQVTDDYETLIVTRKNNKNVVMMSEEMYNNLMENVHIVSSKANFEWLLIGMVMTVSENQSLLLAIYLDFGVGELMKRID